MNSISFFVRNMLHQYDRQLVTSRRLARFRQKIYQAAGENPDENAEQRRKLMVESVARELFENLLFTGSDVPIVQDIQEALMAQRNERLLFKYPPGGLELTILKETEDGFIELSAHEKENVLAQAWTITLHIVDDTML